LIQKTLTLLFLLTLFGCANDSSSMPEEFSGLKNFIVVLNEESVQNQSLKTAAVGAEKASMQSLVVNALQEVDFDHALGPSDKIFSVVLQGGVYKLSSEEVAELKKDSRIAYIEEDRVVQINATQSSAPWGLDRLDQNSLPLNSTYSYPHTAENVSVYIIDTGILLSHQALKSQSVSGYDAVDGGDALDCNGHGSHVAGTVGSAAYGVAKGAKLVAVRVLDCGGSGTISNVVAGIEWVTSHHQKPAVANMSLGIRGSQAIDDAVAASVKAGVTYVVAAGNESDNACNYSPAKVPTAITVGATNSSDARASFSNYGLCVSLFAPGQDILSAWSTSSSATNTISGTSMASPHVAGIAALYLAEHPAATPAQVKAALVAGALNNKISSVGSGSANLLANISFLTPTAPAPPAPVPTEVILKNKVQVKSLKASKGDETYFRVEPAKSGTVTVSISSGSGDADLYVKVQSKPTQSSYACRPYKNGNSESCKVSVKAGEVVYVMLRAYANYSGVSLKASF
jgi:serine protease